MLKTDSIATHRVSIRYLFTSVLCLMLLGCATPYYGKTEAEWNALTEIQQQSLKMEYREIRKLQQAEKRREPMETRTKSIIDWAMEGPKYGH